MKNLKKYEEFTDKPLISFEDACKWIKDNYSKDEVIQMFDDEWPNWVDHEQMEDEGYSEDQDYDYYIDYNNGEAQDTVKENIILDLKSKFNLDFDIIGDNTNIYEFLTYEYEL